MGKLTQMIATALVILGMIGIWIITAKDGNRLTSGKHDRDPVPYYSKEATD